MNDEDKGLKAGFHRNSLTDNNDHWTRRGNDFTVHVYNPKDPDPWPIGNGPDKWMPNDKS
jgi:hypothetical protein